jgi:hypothetical protein
MKRCVIPTCSPKFKCIDTKYATSKDPSAIDTNTITLLCYPATAEAVCAKIQLVQRIHFRRNVHISDIGANRKTASTEILMLPNSSKSDAELSRCSQSADPLFPQISNIQFASPNSTSVSTRNAYVASRCYINHDMISAVPGTTSVLPPVYIFFLIARWNSNLLKFTTNIDWYCFQNSSETAILFYITLY